MSGLRNTVPIRIKLIGLMLLSLISCAGSVLVVGVSSFLDDKGSYFMDYNLTQVKLAAQSVDHQIQRVVWMAQLIDVYSRNSDVKNIERIYAEGNRSSGLKKLLVLHLTPEGALRVTQSLGDVDGTLAHSLDQLGWNTSRFASDPVLISKGPLGSMAVGTLVRSAEGGGTVSVFFLAPEMSVPENSPDFQFYLVDALGESLFTSGTGTFSIRRAEVVDVLKPVLDEKETSGTRQWSSLRSSGGIRYLAAYQRLKFKDLSVLFLVSEKSAFSLIKGLYFRLLILSLGFLLVTFGLALLFTKRATEGLRAMIAISEKVREGVFSYRVETMGMGNDEVGALATSFNLMAGKIDELMAEAAHRVETRFELETTSIVHMKLMQSQPLNHPKMGFSGQALFAKRCGGDWWHYEEVDDYVILVVGQVEARGLSAAITIASVLGALSTYRGVIKMIPMEAPKIKYLAAHLNTAVLESSGGSQRMTCFVALMDTLTGQMEMINFSHPTPYLFRSVPDDKSSESSENYIRRFEPIPLKKHSPLGLTNGLRAEGEMIQLQPGDMIFWYTSGLLKVLNPQGESMTSDRAFSGLGELYDRTGGQAAEVSAGMMDQLTEFFGEVAQNPPEDLTLVVATIPKKAHFVEPDEELPSTPSVQS